MRVINLVGARPQFVKAAAIHRAIDSSNERRENSIEEVIVHTGQHYSYRLSEIFLEQLGLTVDVNLGVGSGSHAYQTSETMLQFDRVLAEYKPDWVIVYGDTTGTLACALTAAKLHIPLAHVEAGLRGFNRRVPEEINRVVTDYVSDVLFCPSTQAAVNLAAESRVDGVYNVGDVMYDSILHYSAVAESESTILHDLDLTTVEYYLATVHRQENTDDERRLRSILFALEATPRPVILPLHPRTRKMLARFNIDVAISTVRLIEPVSYLDMLTLERNARIIITDSGGMQKEAYWLGVPCVTLEEEETWTELFEHGCNVLAGSNSEKILSAVDAWEADPGASERWPVGLYKGGHAAEEIMRILESRHEA